MLRLTTIVLAPVIIVLSGCVSQIPAYSTDPTVAATVKGARSMVKVAVMPPSFADEGSIVCRAVGPVSLPNSQSFSQYVSDALRLELASAGVYDALGAVELRMKLLRVDFQTTLGATNWYVDGEYTIGGSTYVVSTVYNDRSSYFGDKACANVALYFRPAVTRHIRDVFRHPTFRTQVGLLSEIGATERTKGDTATRLRQLDTLFKDGLISKDDYDVRRKQILDGI